MTERFLEAGGEHMSDWYTFDSGVFLRDSINKRGPADFDDWITQENK